MKIQFTSALMPVLLALAACSGGADETADTADATTVEETLPVDSGIDTTGGASGSAEVGGAASGAAMESGGAGASDAPSGASTSGSMEGGAPGQ